MRYTLNTELSEREIYLIGSIVAQWGFLESDIFEQTLLSYDDSELLPVAMNKNAQFSGVLQLWLDRVVETKEDAKKEVLKAQYDKILSLSEYRQAVVHSRWEWKPDAPDEVTAVRVHNKLIKRVKFTAVDLSEFAISLGEIRYSIRYPGGMEDRAAEMTAIGGYISRSAWKMFTGEPEADNSADHLKPKES